MTKEFGKLSADQLRQLVELLPVLEALRAEFRADMKIRRKAAKARKALEDDAIFWAPLYELPFEKHLETFAKAVGLYQAIVEAGATNDPPGHMLKGAMSESVDDIKLADGVKLGHVIGFTISLERSLESLLVWGRYMNELVRAARGGDDASLFRAVRIDPSVVSCSSVAARISKAVALSDEKFLKALRGAMEGRTGRQRKYLRAVRLAIQALHEAGVSAISNKELRALFIRKLGIFTNSSKGNPEKALRKHFHAARRKSTT